MREIIIWGTGNYGVAAYHYYKNSVDVLCFIDIDTNKWGRDIDGIKICSPAVIAEYKDVHIIIAVKYPQGIEKSLKNDYKIKTYTLFSIREELVAEELMEEKSMEIKDRTVIVAFGGGLGNQMFQYAFAVANEQMGKHIIADISNYKKIKVVDFTLEYVFPKIKMEKYLLGQSEEFVKKKIQEPDSNVFFVIYKEPVIHEVEKMKPDYSLLEARDGVFSGLFQCAGYAEKNKGLLKERFQFDVNKEEKLIQMAEYIQSRQFISVHVRRGDYLGKWIYSDICTEEYYKHAMQYMKKSFPHHQFCFFSNDTRWVRENFDLRDSIVIDSNLFDNYEDWYDMYLMSLCHHNIIANSTFSWWGAWLNPNEEKTVIAPEKWVNSCDYPDIYPQDWIKM